jgi:hypothetical protein
MTDSGRRLPRPTTVPTDPLEVYVLILTAVPDTMRQPEALDDHTAAIRQLHGMVRLGNEVANGGFSQFFFNGGGVCVDDAIAGFAAAGLPDHSALADAAAAAGVARIGDLRTALETGTLEAYGVWAEGSGLDGFDDQWYALPDIDDALDRFVADHAEEIWEP